MNWLSTTKTKSNSAASACRARAMYQSMSTLASPGISGSSQVFCCPGPPTPTGATPNFNCRSVISGTCRGRLAGGELGADERDHLAITDRVRVGLVTADQQGVGTGVDVGDQR